MENKEKMLSGLLKAGIIGVGTLVGVAVAKCFNVVREEPEEVPDSPEFIDAEFKEVEEETEEV